MNNCRHLCEQSWASMQTVSRPPALNWVATLDRSRLTRATATLVHTGFPHKHRIPENIFILTKIFLFSSDFINETTKFKETNTI